MAQLETADFFPPLGEFGGPGEDPWPLAAGVDPLALDAHKGKDLLLIIEADCPTSIMEQGLFGPLGDMIYPEDGEWGWPGVRQTLYVAATTGRSTRNDDTPAKTWVPSKLSPSLNFGSKLFDGVDPLKRSRPGQGEIVLNDPDGELDYLFDYSLDGATITIKRGDRGSPYGTWETVGKFTAAGMIHDYDSKRIRLRDLSWALSAPLHDEYYGGTGGLDGDVGLANVWKPWALGYCNTKPVMLNAEAQILQWSFTSSAAVLAFRHGGVELPFHADYPTFEALRDASIPSGHYGTCLAHSLARPNIDIEKGIRVDVIGDADTAYGRPGPTKRGAIARRIATTHGVSRLNDETQIDPAAFNALDLQHVASVGWFFDEPISKADALDLVMGGILGWWTIKRDGRMAVGWVESPALGSSLNFAFKSYGMSAPRVVDWAPPRAGTIMTWRRNHAPEGRSELATSVSEATAEILSKSAQNVRQLSPAVTNMYPTAATVVVDNSGFWFQADADVECARQQGVLEVPRSRYQWDMAIDPYVDLQGLVATLTGLDRMQASGGKPLLNVGVDTPGTDSTMTEWWG